MSTEFYWRIPTHGDSSTIRKQTLNRGDWRALAGSSLAPGQSRTANADADETDDFAYIDHVAEIAKAAEIAGFYGALVPSFPFTEEPWILSAAIARETKSLHFMLAFQPSFIHPVYAAKMSATLQRLSGDRVEWNIITGGGGPSQRWWGDFGAHDDRYTRTEEFLRVARGVWSEEIFDYQGKIFRVEKGGLQQPLRAERFPTVFFSGSSEAAFNVAAKQADVYLSWLEPFDDLRIKFDRVREKASQAGRKIRLSVRVDLIARETESEAWREVDRAWRNTDHEAVEQLYRNNGGNVSDSVGAKRQSSLRPDNAQSYKDLIVAPNLWSGMSLVRPGPTLGIVGNYQQVAERLNDLRELGVDTFILAGTPHLEEAYRIGEEVLPLLSEVAEPVRDGTELAPQLA